MVRIFRRAAQFLVAASALGASLTPWSRLDARPTHPPRLVASLQVSPSQARLEAMKVELALLADPVVYRLPLEVRVRDDGVELCGVVGTDKLRQHALRTARQACYLPVRDGIDVAGAKRQGRSVSIKALRAAARKGLYRDLGDRAASFEIDARADGQITLRGQVDSMEDKLHASRCLRGLPGCNSVVNELAVRPVRRAGHTITLVTRDGREVVHGPVSPSPTEPIRHAEPQVAREDDEESVSLSPLALVGSGSPVVVPARALEDSGSPVVVPPAPSPTIPSGLPPARDVYVRLRSANQVHPIIYVAPPASDPAVTAPLQAQAAACSQVGGYAAMTSPTAQPALQQRRLLIRERLANLIHKPTLVEVPPTVLAPPPAPGLVPAPGSLALVQAPVHAPVAVPPVVQVQDSWPPAHKGAPSAGPAQPRKSTGAAQTVLPPSPAVHLAARPELAPPAPPAAPSPVQALLRASPGAPPLRATPIGSIPAPQVAQTPAPPLATPGRMAPIPVLPARAPVTFTLPATLTPTAAKSPAVPVIHIPTTTKANPTAQKAKPTAQAAPGLPPARIHQLVTRAGGKLAREVRVEMASDQRQTVHVYAVPGAEKELITRLLQVPEIAASNLRLHIHIAP